MRNRLPLLLAAALVVSCDEPAAEVFFSEPRPEETRLEPPPDLTGIPTATYFGPHTITQDSENGETVDFTLDALPYASFAAPFILHVRSTGASGLVAQIAIDGVTILYHGELTIALEESDGISFVAPIEDGSTLNIRMKGTPGSALTFWIEAPVRTAPLITITTPARGAMIQGGTFEPSVVEIVGTACDAVSPITELEVAGTVVPVSGTNLCEPFAVTQQSAWGMSIIEGRARNAAGAEGTLAQAYLRSPDYFPVLASHDPSGRARQGLYVQLNAPAIDDGNRADFDDMATLLQHRMNELDINAAFPNPLYYACNDHSNFLFDLYTFANLRPGAYSDNGFGVDAADAHEGVILLSGGLSRPSLDLVFRYGTGSDCGGGIRVDGSISTDRIASDFTVGLEIRNNLRVHPTTVIVSNLDDGDTQICPGGCGFPSFIVSWIANVFDGSWLSVLEDGVEMQMVEAVGGAADELVQADVSEHTLNGATIAVATATQELTFHGGGFARITQYMQFVPLGIPAGTPMPAHGAMRAGGSLPVFSATDYAVGFGLHQDVLNQAFWAAWRGGAFTVDDLPLGTGAVAGSVDLEALLPPVSMARTDGDAMLRLGMGDLHVRASIDPSTFGGSGALVEVEAWVSAIVSGDVGYDATTRSLVLANGDAQVSVQLASALPGLDAPAIAVALAGDLRAPLLALAAGALATTPVPALFDDGDVADTELTLGAGTLDRSGTYYRLMGQLE